MNGIFTEVVAQFFVRQLNPLQSYDQLMYVVMIYKLELMFP